MRAKVGLAGVAYGMDCHCMALDDVRGNASEATALRGDELVDSLAPDDPVKCSGVDVAGELQRGVYLCRHWSLGPMTRPSAGSSTLR